MSTIVYRVIPANKAADIHIGDVIPIPKEDVTFVCAASKAKTEDIFESERIVVRPNYPSRKACLFVFPFNEEVIENWLSSAHAHDDFNYALLTLELTGTLIWCDMDKFTLAGTPFGVRLSETLAHDYWESAGADYSGFDLPEGLFIGHATITNIELKHHKGI